MTGDAIGGMMHLAPVSGYLSVRNNLQDEGDAYNAVLVLRSSVEQRTEDFK